MKVKVTDYMANYDEKLLILCLLIISALLSSSCAPIVSLWSDGVSRPSLLRVEYAEKLCSAIDCYQTRLDGYPPTEDIDADGNLKWTWRSTVTKTRPLRDGEKPIDKRHYRYQSQSCWFTVTFNPDGEAIETEWRGPGCF